MCVRLSRVTALSTAAVVIMAVLSGCGDDATDASSDYANELKQKISTEAVTGHLSEFQRIADANNGTRQTGGPGYDASVDYVVKLLSDRGFDVETPQFDLALFRLAGQSMTLNGRTVNASAVEYSGSTSAAGVNGRFVPLAAGNLGCEPSDYDGIDVRGAVVLVDRGECYLSEKALLAADRGAVGVVIANDVDEKVFSGGLLESDGVTIPVLSVSLADSSSLRSESGDATVVVDAQVEHLTSHSVIATTTTGSRDDIVVVGAHLDSVRGGPGINDNGSGVAALLETALQMGPSPELPNAVRFAFWGGEEEWLIGSENYVGALDQAALQSIALYLNVDMAASPNPGYLVLDADLTIPADPELGFGVPAGSEVIERAFVDYFASAGITAGDLAYDGRGDWNPFARAGVPVGSFSTGGEEIMTAEQAQLWGGAAGQPFDPNYHSADDTFAHINTAALDITGPAIAYLVGLFAQGDTEYGVAAQEDRERQPLKP